MKAEIISITVVTQQGVSQHYVGTSGIAKIQDESLQYDDHVHSLYYGYNESGKLMFKIENCPVEVIYK